MKVFAYLIAAFGSLPGWVKVMIYLLLSAAVVAIAGYFGLRAALIAALVMLLLGLFLLAYALLAQWVRQRKAAELRGEFDGTRSDVVDLQSSEVAEQTRREFEEGLGKFEVSGKELYEVPWYLLVGEPGSGKTTAIRNSDVELARELTDPEAEAGKDRLLQWWFTNYGVILDTAGSVVFGSGTTGTTSSWRALASLLKERRRNCPINGLILTIPVRSLLRDSPDTVTQKAGTIARHLDTLRNDLGVKFPVFVLITQSDELPGFTPFFSGMDDPKAAQQMLGWSNPAPLEAPVRPELVDEYYAAIAQRLRRRRLSLLLDPVPAVPGHRRTDEVDELFELPTAIEDLIPNLRIYLENIFVPGEWSSRPVFLRGVYLTSAEQPFDPSRLEDDEEKLAREGSMRAAVPQSSFFLRDVFLDKIFREDSLVTSAGTGQRERYRRRLILFFLSIVGLAALFVGAIRGYQELVTRTAQELPLWERATFSWNDNGWIPIVRPSEDDPAQFVFMGAEPIGSGLKTATESRFSRDETTLTQFHEDLAKSASVPLHIPLVFRPFVWIGSDPDRSRFYAQRVVFENSVVNPLLTATRSQMTQPVPDATQHDNKAEMEAYLAHEAKALTELVRIEVANIARSRREYTLNPGSTFIPALLDYLTNTSNDPVLVSIMNWTYGSNPSGIHSWAPSWTSGGDTLEKNTAIGAGIDRLITYAQQRVANLEEDLAALSQLAEAAKNYNSAEGDLSQAASVKDDPSRTEQAVANAFEALEASKIQLEQELNKARIAGLFEAGPETLTSALNNLSSGSDTHLGQVDVILALVNSVLPDPEPKAADDPLASPATSPEGEGQSPTPTPTPVSSKETNVNLAIAGLSSAEADRYKLLLQIRERLTGISGLIDQRIKQKINDKLVSEYSNLDDDLFTPFDGMPSYLWRWNAYLQSASGAPDYHFEDGMYLVDQRWVQLGNLLEELGEIQSRIDSYHGGNAVELLTICNYFINRVQTKQTTLFMTAYVQQAREALLRVARFPLVWPPGPDDQALSVDQLKGAKGLLDAISADLKVPTFTNLPDQVKHPVTEFARRLTPLFNVVDALIKPDGSMSDLRITLYNGQAQRQLSGPNFAPPPSPTPTPTPAPRSLVSKMFGIGAQPTPDPEPTQTLDIQNWNAVSLVTGGTPQGVFPLYGQSDVLLGSFPVQNGFSFRVYHSLSSTDGSALVDGGSNWSALRLIARLDGKPVGVGQDWQIALRPNEPISVWVKFSFDLPLPAMPWPTIDSLGLRRLPGGGNGSDGSGPPAAQPTPAVTGSPGP